MEKLIIPELRKTWTSEQYKEEQAKIDAFIPLATDYIKSLFGEDTMEYLSLSLNTPEYTSSTHYFTIKKANETWGRAIAKKAGGKELKLSLKQIENINNYIAFEKNKAAEKLNKERLIKERTELIGKVKSHCERLKIEVKFLKDLSFDIFYKTNTYSRSYVSVSKHGRVKYNSRDRQIRSIEQAEKWIEERKKEKSELIPFANKIKTMLGEGYFLKPENKT